MNSRKEKKYANHLSENSQYIILYLWASIIHIVSSAC